MPGWSATRCSHRQTSSSLSSGRGCRSIVLSFDTPKFALSSKAYINFEEWTYIFDSPDLRGHMRVRLNILSVEVKPRKAASVVPYYHSIWVNHGNYLEDECVP